MKKDLSCNGKVKTVETCTRLPEFERERDVRRFVKKWRTGFLGEVKDEFIKSKVDEICDTLVYFLFAGDVSGTLLDPNGVYYFNFNIDGDNLYFAFYK